MKKILHRLAEVASRDASLVLFGAKNHRYRTLPPGSEHELAELERRLGVPLPTGYRDFVLTISSGGAGPGYGLQWLPLAGPAQGEVPSWCRERDLLQMQTFIEKRSEIVLLPFPHVAPAVFDGNAVVKGMSEGLDGEAFDREFERLDEEARKRLKVETWDHGLLPLADYGCTMRAMLVVTGAERGQVWVEDFTEGRSVVPFEACPNLHGKKASKPAGRGSFREWYRHWLESAERELG